MKKIRSIIIIFIMMLVILLFGQTRTLAAGTASISGPSSVESGSNITVSVTLKNVASWNINISATGATTGNSKRLADATEDAMNTTKTFSFTCQSTGEGTITIKVTGDVSTEDGKNNDINISKTITVSKKKEDTTSKPVQTPSTDKKTTTNSATPVTESNNKINNKNNEQINPEEQKRQEEEQKKQEEERKKQEELAEKRLESLSINGYSMIPEFNQDVEEYFVEVPISEEKVIISAKTLNSQATIEGTGEFNINEGNNIFEIIVTAVNGDKKTYKINVTAEDKNPIILSMNGKEYTIIKRNSLLTNPDSCKYKETIIKINNVEVPSFKNNENNEIIISVKDENGEITYLRLQDIMQQLENQKTLKKEKNPYIILSIILGILLAISIGINVFMLLLYSKKIKENGTK